MSDPTRNRIRQAMKETEFIATRIALPDDINELAKREARRSGDSKKRWIERLIENYLREQYATDLDLKGFQPPGLRRR